MNHDFNERLDALEENEADEEPDNLTEIILQESTDE